MFGDGGSDAFGCACDDSDFAAEFLVFVDIMILFCGFVEDSLTCSSNKNSDIFRGRFRILMLR